MLLVLVLHDDDIVIYYEQPLLVGQGGTSLPWSRPEHYHHLGMAWKMVSKKENVSMISCRGQNRTDSIVCTDEKPLSGLKRDQRGRFGGQHHLFIVLRAGAALCPLKSCLAAAAKQMSWQED